MKTIKYPLILLSILLFSSLANAKPTQKWIDQKFSMFIHFGLYSEYGGVYNGEPVKRGYSEQIQSFAGIFSDWYGESAEHFNPTKWNADSIVNLAKKAGMKSIVFTSKHHDGFCMFNSKYTSFNIAKATPYHRDLMKELSDACQRGGIDFSVYFSLIDWHFPQAYPISSHNADKITPEHYQFNLKQVEEIMTNYGKISEIWFDMGSLTIEQSKGLYQLVQKLQPQCMISGRLGNDFVDFSVMADNEYPNYKLAVPWQTAASMFDETWGYRSWQKHGNPTDKATEKIKSLVKVVSHGGNYLLNIGPKGDGSVVPFEKNVLLQIGNWLGKYGKAIYAKSSNPFSETVTWGEITSDKDNLYLFISKDYQGKTVQLPKYQGKVVSAINLANGAKAVFSNSKRELQVPNATDLAYSVVQLKFKNGYKIAPEIADIENLNSKNAEKEFGHSAFDYYCGYKTLLAYNWHFKSHKNIIYPTLKYTESEIGKNIFLTADQDRKNIVLASQNETLMELDRDKIELGKIYQSEGRGVFGSVKEENNNDFEIEKDSLWSELSTFEYGSQKNRKVSARHGFLLAQQIESTTDNQKIAVEIGSDEAYYVLLNGKYITANFQTNVSFHKHILLLNLKKGENQLIIKYFSRYRKNLYYSFKVLDSWKEYSMNVGKMRLNSGKLHNIGVKLSAPDTKVQPILMSNLKIECKK